MNRWFRHYVGMMRDEKLVRAAVKAKQPVHLVVWVWGAILESAAEINDGGRYEFDPGEAAYFLRCDDADLGSILASLESLGRLSGGVVVRWGDRQYSSDAAAERQRRYRERKSVNAGVSADERNGDGESDVTPPSRDGVVTAQETDTEAETEDKPPAPVLGAEGARDLFDEIWGAFPRNPSSVESKARKAFNATKVEDRPGILAAALAYAQWFEADCDARKRTLDAGARFAPHLSNWISEGTWRQPVGVPAKPSGPVVPMVKLDRERDHALWLECERVQGKKAPTSGLDWSFRAEVVAAAREAIGHRVPA